MVTKEEVFEAQKKWADGIIKIGSLRSDPEQCKEAAETMIKELYAYEIGNVLFKPTKATQIQFRISMEGARSYFIGGDKYFEEDQGFALQPWKKIRFVNAGLILEVDRALAMGNYFFTNQEGDETKVEYTFGYIKDTGGNLKIDLHHSSLPYTG
ncbi:hypothetical protein ACFLYK_00995 [Candidatus Cloacimonadota bacterium]